MGQLVTEPRSGPITLLPSAVAFAIIAIAVVVVVLILAFVLAGATKDSEYTSGRLVSIRMIGAQVRRLFVLVANGLAELLELARERVTF